MNTSTLTPLYRGLVALLAATSVACVAVIIHYIVEEVTQGIFNPGHFFSYFTIQVGLLFALVNLAYLALKPWRAHPYNPWLKWLEVARFSTMVLSVIILPVYWFMVSTPSQWALDWWSVIHLAMPIVAVLTWFTMPYSTRPALSWTFWPFAYVIPFALWSLVHGAIAADHWFPYDFFDFVANGWGFVLLRFGALLVGVIVLSFTLNIATLMRAKLVTN